MCLTVTFLKITPLQKLSSSFWEQAKAPRSLQSTCNQVSTNYVYLLRFIYYSIYTWWHHYVSFLYSVNKKSLADSGEALPFRACRLPGLDYPFLVDGRAGGPHHALGRSCSAFSLKASFLVQATPCKYGRWELATSSDICVLTRASGRLGDNREPTTSAWQGGSCHRVQGWAGQYIGDVSLSLQLIYFISVLFLWSLRKRGRGKKADKAPLSKLPAFHAGFITFRLLGTLTWGTCHSLSFSAQRDSTNKPLKKNFCKKILLLA